MAAATAVVSAMATDGWQQVCSAVGRLWRQVHPERAATVEGELADVRTEILAARATGAYENVEDFATDWARRIQRLLAAGKSVGVDLEVELQHLLDHELIPLLSPAGQENITKITMKARASGQARIFQAGRDQHITGT